MAVKRKKPARGSPRVAAWLYGVINPLIEALEREQQFLANGNLTWRPYSKAPEYILRPADYLSANGQTNLDDLELFYPEFKKHLDRHAQLLSVAIDEASRAHQRR